MITFKILYMSDWILLGKPRIIERALPEVLANYDSVYGYSNWKLTDIDDTNFLMVKNFTPDEKDSLYFVTSNPGKVNSAQRSLGDFVKLKQAELTISENDESIEDIAIYKARVAYSVMCRPILCDDSGLVIPKFGNWPGVLVGREIKRLGEEGFANLFKDEPLPAYFKMAVTYFDKDLEEPKVFISTVNGKFQYESKGDPDKPFIKNKVIGTRFIPDTSTKTLAEMTEEEYKRDATTDRWKALINFLKENN